MLSAHERRQLRDIEQHLYTDDPDFARTLSDPTKHSRHIAALLLAILAVTLIVLGVTAAGFPLLFFGTVTAMISACVYRTTRSCRTTTQR
jgi:Flp pilus assembly protein TadB